MTKRHHRAGDALARQCAYGHRVINLADGWVVGAEATRGRGRRRRQRVRPAKSTAGEARFPSDRFRGQYTSNWDDETMVQRMIRKIVAAING